MSILLHSADGLLYIGSYYIKLRVRGNF